MKMHVTTLFGNLYLGNKMSGVPYFNAPWFDFVTAHLRTTPGVESVFNPAEWDRLRGFNPLDCPNGTPEEAAAAGFDLRTALASDWKWIAEHSNGLVIGPDWRTSKGTISEIACHQALGLPVWEYRTFVREAVDHNEPENLLSSIFQFPPLGGYLL